MSANSEHSLRFIVEGLRRLLELHLRVQVHTLKGEKNQTEMILLLNGLGFTSAEIASMLPAPLASVKPIVSRTKTKPPRQGKAR
jgi:DNA-directed RNA polymerase specialized sigma24 family protein